MAGPQVLYPVLLLFLAYWRSTALLSNLKTCGDPQCARSLSRVQATQDYKGPDCRFLSFRRGEVIFVYSKLSGKRDDLWGGSIDSKFKSGYFPKDAVKVEEVYIAKEIEIPTQEQDFFCIDELGAIFEGDSSEWNDQGEKEGIQKAPADDSQLHETRISEQGQQSSVQSTEDTDTQEENQAVMPDPLENTKSQTNEQGGSNWIGSGLTGLLGFDGRSVSDSKHKKTEDQDSFKSRKIALDVDVNQLEKEVKTETVSWFGERLTSVLGFGEKSPDTTSKKSQEMDELAKQNKEEATTESLDTEGTKLDQKEATAAGSWLNGVIGNVLSFQHTTDGSQHQDSDLAEKVQTLIDKPSSSDSSQTDDEKHLGEETKNHPVENILTENKEHNTDSDGKDTKVKNDGETGWYSSVYGSIKGLYDRKEKTENYVNLQEDLQEAPSQSPGSGQSHKVTQDESANNAQSLLSVGGISAMIGSLKSEIQPDIQDDNSDLQTHNEPAVTLTAKGKEASTQHITGTLNMPAEDSKRDGTGEDMSTNESHPSAQESTRMHNEIESVAEEIFTAEDLSSVNSHLKSELESHQPQPSGVSEELSGYTEPNSSQAEEVARKQLEDVSNTDDGPPKHLPNVFQEQVRDKYNTDFSVSPKTISDQPVVAEKISDEELHKVDGIKEEEKSLGAETHYHVREEAQYPGADYSEQESSVDSRKELSLTDNGIESAVMDSEDESSLFDRKESSVSDRGKHPTATEGWKPSSVTDSKAGPHVTDNEKELSFTDCEKRSPVIDSEGETTMIETGYESDVSSSVEGSLTIASVEKLAVMDAGKESSIIYNADKSTVNERSKGQTVFEKEEETSSINSKEKLTGIEEGSSVIESDKKSAEIEREEGLTVAKSKEGSVDGHVDNTGKLDWYESVTETPEVQINIQSPHLMFPAAEEKSEINSSLVSDEKEYKANIKHGMTVSTEEDEKKLSYQSSLPEHAETGQQGIESEDTKIYSNSLTDEPASVVDVKMGKESEDLLHSSPKMILENSENRTPHVKKLDSHSVLPQRKSDYTPEATEGGTYKQTLAKTQEAAAEVLPESNFRFSAGNSEQEVQMATKEFSEVNELQDETSTTEERKAITCDSLSTCGQYDKQKETFAGDADVESVYSKTGMEQKAAEVPKNTSDVSQSETFAKITDEILMEETSYAEGNSYSEVSECEQFPSSSKNPETCRIDSSDKTRTVEEEKSSEAQSEPQGAEEQEVSEATRGHVSEEQPLPEKSSGNSDYNGDEVISQADEDSISSSHSKSYESLPTTTDKNNVAHSEEEVYTEGSVDTLHSEELATNKLSEETTESPPQKKYIDTAEQHLNFPEAHRIPNTVTHFLKSTKTLKEYKNIQKHMSEEDLLHVLDILGKHKLLWLDYQLGNPEDKEMVGSISDDLPILSDLERMLQYHIEMAPASKGSRDGDTKAQNGYASLQKLRTLLSTLKSRFTAEKSAVDINSNQADTGRPEDSPASIPSDEKDSETQEGEKADKLNRNFGDGDPPTTNQRDTGLYQTGIRDIITLCLTFAGQVVVQGKDHIQYSFTLFKQVVSSLPTDMTPGPDLYGLPWEAVIPTVLVGVITLLLFTCRSYQSIKSRLYVGKEKKMGQKVAELLEEKCKVLETLSQCQHKYEELEAALQNGGISAQASERENLEVMSRKLEQSNAQLNNEVEQLKQDLKAQRSMRSQQEEMLASMQETLKNLEQESKDLKSKIEQAQITVKIHNINSEKLQTNLQVAKEENAQLLESKAQLVQEAEGWAERLNELEEEMKMCESSHKAMLEDCSNKDQHIKSLTDCLLKMRDWDSEEEDQTVEGECEEATVAAGDNKDGTDVYQKQKVQKLIYAAKMSADLKSVEEDKNRLLGRLADEVKAKADLREGIERLQNEKDSLQVESTTYSSETQKLQQKLQIMTEMYQENELKLHSMLTVEERERLQKEEKLNKADKKISQAAEELSSYRQRAQELEEELEKTNQAYRNQIAAHEKKAHDNWLAARAADRDLANVKRENALLRQKLTDSQFKLEMVEKDPFIGRPPFRGERSPFGHSPLGRPSSETRAFLSPPTLMDGPPRLSPQFPLGPGGRASRGPSSLADHTVASEGEGCGPHSDSGSVSPTWEKDRRGSVPPPGFPYPDPGFHYRRPPPGAVPLGPLPPRGPGPAEAHIFSTHPMDRSADSSLLSSYSDGRGLSESRDSLLSAPGEPRIPPEADIRKGPGMGPPIPLDPREQLPRRGVYIPPEFFPPRGPPMGMRGPPPPGIFPRFPPMPPQHMGYPPTRPQLDMLSGPPRRPSPPGSEQPPEQTPSSQELI